jgi:quercetin dioxygenase-like cupin family protein
MKSHKPLSFFDENLIFQKESSVGPREWGEETLLGLIPGTLTLKRITMKKGASGGFQYHREKKEIAILQSGRLRLLFFRDFDKLEERIINPGEVFFFPPYFAHKAVALEDSVYIEASNPVFNDRVRVENLIGWEETGLPTTNDDEILWK